MALMRFLLLTSISFCFQSANSQTARDTLHVLFVGNSYTYFSNLPHIVSIISDSTQTKIMTRKSTAGGARLSQHWKGDRGLQTKKLIEEGQFDIVVLQEQSMGTIEQADSFAIYAGLFCDFIKANLAKPYFYLTWAREKVPQYQEIITTIYTDVAKKNDAGIVPAGEAWALAQKLRPGIDLFTSDGSHPSSLGTLLTACIFVKTLSGELPTTLRRVFSITDKYGEMVRLMSHDPLDITFCLKVAEDIAPK